MSSKGPHSDDYCVTATQTAKLRFEIEENRKSSKNGPQRVVKQSVEFPVCVIEGVRETPDVQCIVEGDPMTMGGVSE